ncbi:hypothetical protein Cgig2_027684 [Carnegiea gigantea]|uniref:Uncharacterized protein n=1 Tax=Carnegiea gigantea TaxID=171969 RepID=A0A9Q1GXK9_9CARY|nr:hypothetical protein Cgig2_027684 [Carnegiea gigantea]
MDALKNFMSTMTDAIMQQVSEQVNKAVEATSSARPLPHFEYVPTTGSEPSHRDDPMMSPLQHHHLGLPEEVDLPGEGDCPFGAPHLGLWGPGGNPRRIIRLPLSFGNKVKTEGAQALIVKKKDKKKQNDTLGALDVGLFITIATLGSLGGITLLVRYRSLPVQKCGLLVAQTFFNS